MKFIAKMLLLLFPFFLMGKSIATNCDEYLIQAEKNWHFSGSVLIVKKGKILLSKGYGHAIFEHSIANNESTIFRMASLTKPITATAILYLCEKGYLDLNTPISYYLPNFSKRMGKKITIHHLLTHTSGLPDYLDYANLEWKRINHSPEELLKSIRNKTLLFRPGTQVKQSHTNYILLGAIIEAVTEKTYDDFLEDTFFTPLKMFASGYNDERLPLPKKAIGYAHNEKGKLICAPFEDLSIHYSSAGLYTCVEDLYLWDKALEEEKLISKKSMQKAWTPHAGHYGYGWSIQEKFSKKMATHTGAINGFVATYIKFFDDGLTVIILSNNEKSPTKIIAESLAAIAFGFPYELPTKRQTVMLPSSQYQKYIGQYMRGDKNEIKIYTNKDRLFLLLDNKKKQELFPLTAQGNDFYCKDKLDLKITFHQDSLGEANFLVIYENNQEFIFKKNFEDATI